MYDSNKWQWEGKKLQGAKLPKMACNIKCTSHVKKKKGAGISTTFIIIPLNDLQESQTIVTQ